MTLCQKICISIAVLMMASESTPLTAQEITIPDFSEPFGNLASPELVSGPVTAEEEAVTTDEDQKKVNFFLSPGFVDTKGAFISSLTLGGGVGSTQFDIRYADVGIEDGSADFDQFRFKLKQQIKLKGDRAKLSFVAQYTDLESVSESGDLLLAGSWRLSSEATSSNMKLTANVGWSEKKPEGGEAVDDLVVGVGLSFRASANLGLAVDYTLENDVNQGDGYSLTAVHTLAGGSNLIFGVAKEGTIYASYLVTF